MSDDPTRPIRPGWPSQPDPRSTPQRGRETRRDWGAPGGQPGQSGRGGQSGWGGQSGQGYSQGQGGQGGQGDWGGGRAARPRRRHRGLTITAIVVVVLLVLLVVADRVAAGLAENEAASQIQSAGFPVKPKGDIEGLPF